MSFSNGKCDRCKRKTAWYMVVEFVKAAGGNFTFKAVCKRCARAYYKKEYSEYTK